MVVRRFFLTVSNVELVYHSANVAITNEVVISLPILYLESNILSKVFQRDLSGEGALLDMNFGHRKHLAVSYKIVNRFANLVILCFVQVKTFKCISYLRMAFNFASSSFSLCWW